MPLGPGKYDDLCTYVREKTKADGVIVVIIDGERGSGFSMQADPLVAFTLPHTLRNLAQQIEDSLTAGKI